MKLEKVIFFKIVQYIDLNEFSDALLEFSLKPAIIYNNFIFENNNLQKKSFNEIKNFIFEMKDTGYHLAILNNFNNNKDNFSLTIDEFLDLFNYSYNVSSDYFKFKIKKIKDEFELKYYKLSKLKLEYILKYYDLKKI